MSPRREAEALGLLGLAHRAGAVLPGVTATRRGLEGRQVRLVVLARDAAGGQLDKVRGLLAHQDVPTRWVEERTTLGRALGRTALSAVGVTDGSFAERLQERLPAGPPRGSEAGKRGKAQEGPSRDAGC